MPDECRDVGLTMRQYWVNEWVKAPGARRGRRRKRLKIYWVQGEILHSGPFYSQEEAILFLVNNQLSERAMEDEYVDCIV
jgi:hypothetical protein